MTYLNKEYKTIRQSGIDSENFLDIMFFPIMYCNHKCSYCFVNNKDKKSCLDPKVFDDFKNFNMDLTLNLGGGEPTQILNFDKVYEKINRIR